ncbi:MAG: hypothetical protein QY318_04360 [Candidatus Dojkabacteria bacterium]|nr:MAG: hypothetical protein QY318_04360 [Candidatus Dojkabacteria bacterium]
MAKVFGIEIKAPDTSKVPDKVKVGVPFAIGTILLLFLLWRNGQSGNASAGTETMPTGVPALGLVDPAMAEAIEQVMPMDSVMFATVDIHRNPQFLAYVQRLRANIGHSPELQQTSMVGVVPESALLFVETADGFYASGQYVVADRMRQGQTSFTGRYFQDPTTDENGEEADLFGMEIVTRGASEETNWVIGYIKGLDPATFDQLYGE